MAKVGRPPVLDELKKREICALVFAGCSRHVAAQYVGCSSSTIIYAEERDPAFAEQLRVAEISNEAGLLHSIKEQAKRSWRAAAWYLDRVNPDRYGRRKPRSVAPEQACQIMAVFTELMMECVPRDEDRDRIRARVLQLIETLKFKADEEEYCHDRRNARRQFDLHPGTWPEEPGGDSDEDAREFSNGRNEKNAEEPSGSR